MQERPANETPDPRATGEALPRLLALRERAVPFAYSVLRRVSEAVAVSGREREELRDLVERYLAGALEPGEGERLDALLRGGEEALRELAAAARRDAALRAALRISEETRGGRRDEAGGTAAPPPAATRPKRAFVVPLAGAAAVLLALAGLMAVLRSPDGPAREGGGPGTGGARGTEEPSPPEPGPEPEPKPSPGAGVRQTKLADGSVLLAGPWTALELPPDGAPPEQSRRIRLLRGTLHADVAKSERGIPFVVQTDAGDLRVTGTRFRVHLDRKEKPMGTGPGKALVQVLLFAGALTLANPQGAVDLLAGDAAFAEEGTGTLALVVVVNRLPDGSIGLAAGPAFTYYEFKHPMKDRLTDEKWRAMLEERGGVVPEKMPEFARSRFGAK